MKVSHLRPADRELTISCSVRYGFVVVHGGTDWITPFRVLVEMEWRAAAEEVRDTAR
jgi:hypothetical protein